MQDSKEINFVWGKKLGQSVEQAFDFDTAMQGIIDDRNANTIEFNSLVDDNEEMSGNLELLRVAHTDLFAKCEKQQSIIEDSVKVALAFGELKRSNALSIANESTKDKLIKNLTADIKAAKEQVARNRKANTLLVSRNARLTKEAKTHREAKTDNMAQFPCVYNVDGEMLVVYPQMHRMNLGDGSKVDQAVLLFTDMSGVFLTACLDVNHEAVFSSPLRNGCNLSERTVNTYRKHSIRPSQAVVDFARIWLYRVNIEQKAQVEQVDLILYKGE